MYVRHAFRKQEATAQSKLCEVGISCKTKNSNRPILKRWKDEWRDVK